MSDMPREDGDYWRPACGCRFRYFVDAADHARDECDEEVES